MKQSKPTHIRSQRKPCKLQPLPPRRGVVLLVVLVVIVMLTLGVYAYSEISVSEADATKMYERQFQSRALAESGLEMAKLSLDQTFNTYDDDYFDIPDMFSDQLLIESDELRGEGRWALVNGRENDPNGQLLRFGLTSESGKLNLNSLIKWKLPDSDAQKVLLELPEMTPELADAILDWIDEDSQPRNFGAETEFYASLPEPYAAANGPLQSFDELLYVRGVTPALLYGEDANRNGILDPGEDDGDGIFQRGWIAFLTVYTKEANKQLGGEDRIFLNEPVLATMYDALEDQYDEQTARFVAAYRISGKYDPQKAQQSGSQQSGQSGQNGSQPQTTTPQSSTQTTDSTSEDSKDSKEGETSQADQAEQQAAQEANKQPENAKRGGMDLTAGAKVTIKSIYELIDVQAEATIDGKKQVLQSPWQVGSSDLGERVLELVNTTTLSKEEILVGRINLNHARPEVVMNLPGMTGDLLESINRYTSALSGEALEGDDAEMHKTLVWLLTEGNATAEQLKELDRFLTGRGDVFRVQAVGYYSEGGPVTRLEMILDATQSPPTVLEYNDLTPLGPGFTPEQLMTQ